MADPLVLLELNEMYCGHAARVAIDRDGDLLGYRVFRSRRSRGWSYSTFAGTDELDLATKNLERLLGQPSDITPQILRVDPRWWPRRGHESFEAVMARYEARRE